MKNLLISFLFAAAGHLACGQIPSAGNVLWLRADRAVFNNNSGTIAIPGDLVQVWQDQSGSGNHFYQPVNGYRPQLVVIPNTLCSQPLIQFDVSRRTYLASAFKLSGTKTVFLVFLQPAIAGNPETLISIKGVSNTYTEILCADHPLYQTLSYICEAPSSTSGGTMVPSVGNNVSFSSTGNIFRMTYNGGAISSAASYSSSYNALPVPVSPSGLFGRLVHDTTTIGARAPEQNYSFLSGYIAEVIVYNRVLAAAEINQVETYLQGKYGFSGLCSVLPAGNMDFSAKLKGNAVQLDWLTQDETGMKSYTVEHSIDNNRWDSTAMKPAGDKKYVLLHTAPVYGINYYRLRINYTDGRIKYSETNRVNYYRPGFVQIIPNPVSDHLIVRSSRIEPAHVRILSTDGRLLKDLNIYTNTAVDIHDLVPSVYFIQVNGKTEKLLKQ